MISTTLENFLELSTSISVQHNYVPCEYAEFGYVYNPSGYLGSSSKIMQQTLKNSDT